MTAVRTRRRARRWQGAVLALAAALTTALTQSTTSAAFTAQTGDGGNQVTASGNFCASAGTTTTVAASADTTGYQQYPTTPYGSYGDVGAVTQTTANARALVRFALPTPGAHCALTGATLRLYAHTPAAGRTIDVHRVDPLATWSEAPTTWNTLPATTGAAVVSPSLGVAGWQEWSVTAMVTAHCGGTNSGFLGRDRTEGHATGVWQLYGSRDHATAGWRPQLVLTWG